MNQPNNIIGKDYWEFVERTSQEASSKSDLNTSRDIDVYRAYISHTEIDFQEVQKD